MLTLLLDSLLAGDSTTRPCSVLEGNLMLLGGRFNSTLRRTHPHASAAAKFQLFTTHSLKPRLVVCAQFCPA